MGLIIIAFGVVVAGAVMVIGIHYNNGNATISGLIGFVLFAVLTFIVIGTQPLRLDYSQKETQVVRSGIVRDLAEAETFVQRSNAYDMAVYFNEGIRNATKYEHDFWYGVGYRDWQRDIELIDLSDYE
jgi:ABC-type transport system involved in cytochrome bd biosynthesis fused ATPase/permease subunit